MLFRKITQAQRNAEFFSAVVNCPTLAWSRLGAVQNPSKYTLGEYRLLTMLGLQAGRWLDLERDECRAYAEIRKPVVTERNMPERKYHRYACTQAEWLLATAWGVI